LSRVRIANDVIAERREAVYRLMEFIEVVEISYPILSRASQPLPTALGTLEQIDLARRIEDLRAPPANRLEQLKGDRARQWSIRVNDQFRICFRWTGADAVDVEIVDYH